MLAARIDEPGVACRLPQAEQRFEHVRSRAHGAELPQLLSEARAVVLEELVVVLSLIAVEVDIERLLDAIGQVFGDFTLRPPQYEGPHDALNERAGSSSSMPGFKKSNRDQSSPT